MAGMLQPQFGVGYTLTRVDSDFDPNLGQINHIVYSGLFTPIDALYKSYILAGGRCSVRNNGLRWDLTIDIGASYVVTAPPAVPDPGTPPSVVPGETPEIVWSIKTAASGVDMGADAQYRNKLLQIKAAIEFQFPEAVKPTNESFLGWCIGRVKTDRKILDAAARDAAYDALYIIGTPDAQQWLQVLWRVYDQNQRAFRKWPILTRQRTYSFGYANPIVLDEDPNVRTTSRLIADYSIPPEVQAQLPATPSAPLPAEGAVAYGWKEAAVNQKYMPSNNRYEEVVSWEFRDWTLHDAILLA